MKPPTVRPPSRDQVLSTLSCMQHLDLSPAQSLIADIIRWYVDAHTGEQHFNLLHSGKHLLHRALPAVIVQAYDLVRTNASEPFASYRIQLEQLMPISLIPLTDVRFHGSADRNVMVNTIADLLSNAFKSPFDAFAFRDYCYAQDAALLEAFRALFRVKPELLEFLTQSKKRPNSKTVHLKQFGNTEAASLTHITEQTALAFAHLLTKHAWARRADDEEPLPQVVFYALQKQPSANMPWDIFSCTMTFAKALTLLGDVAIAKQT